MMSLRNVFVAAGGPTASRGRYFIVILALGLALLSVFVSTTSKASVALSPEQFGAVGDGTADDTDAMQAAVDALRRSKGGKLIGRRGAVYRIHQPVILERVSSAQLLGNGATIYRYTAGTASGALSLYGCSGIVIEGWNFTSSYDGYARGSTGSNPNILLGVRRGQQNRGITIRNNRLKNGNHANITVGTTGIDHIMGSVRFANEDIRIESNVLGNAGAAVFIYKATRGFTVANNSGSNFSSYGIAVDTHAGTDPDRNNYEIQNGEVVGNTLRNVDGQAVPASVAAKVPGRPAGFAARGILVKGGVRDLNLRSNSVSGISSITNVETYGVLVTSDQAIRPASPARIFIQNNIIEDVRVVGRRATAAWALGLGPGSSEIMINGNRFRGAERGVLLSDGSSWSFLWNRLEDLATAGAYPLEVRAGPIPPRENRIEGNVFIRGAGVASAAMHLGRGQVQVGTNEFLGFRKQIAGALAN